jgi:hypothetical protein
LLEPRTCSEEAAARDAAQPAGRRAARARLSGDDGMTTAEYAVGTVAACGFGGLLYKLLTSNRVSTMLGDLLERALSVGF